MKSECFYLCMHEYIYWLVFNNWPINLLGIEHLTLFELV